MDFTYRGVTWYCGVCNRYVSYNEAHSHPDIIGNSTSQPLREVYTVDPQIHG